MKKLFLALATILSVSSFAEAGKIVITNDSDYTVEIWTGWFPNPLSDPRVEAGQKLVLDLPDNKETTVKMYRVNLKATGENIKGIFSRMTTAEAPTKSNGLEWASAAYSFGKACYTSYPVTRIVVNPTQVLEGQIKNITITNYEENDTTIIAKLSDKDLIDFADLNFSESSSSVQTLPTIFEPTEKEEVAELDTEAFNQALKEVIELIDLYEDYTSEFKKIEMDGSSECLQSIKNLIEKIKLETTKEVETKVTNSNLSENSNSGNGDTN